MKIHEKYLRRCLQIGANALGSAAPNPMVGALIVHGERIIGEGYTSAYGGAHAEVNALQSVRETNLLKNATLYVSLEPCCHQGKTPPCTDAIINSGIPRVVLGIRDPNPEVAGKGVAYLKKAGIEVIEGVLEGACREHHKRFLTFQEKGRPYIILKWAQSMDGYIAPQATVRDQKPQPYWITGSQTQRLVHKWRTDEMAILVGTQTAIADNPSLTARNWAGKSPYRLVIDRRLRIPERSNLLDGSVSTVLFHNNPKAPDSSENLKYLQLEANQSTPQQISSWAHRNGLSSLIVEGGAKTLELFIAEGLWDEARIFTGTATLKNGINAPRIQGKILAESLLENDQLQILRND